MILEYGGRNCWSFKEWMTINLKLNKNVPNEYGFPNCKVAPFLCFEGGNASGKTVALRVLTFIMDFCKNSFSREPESQIPYESFYNNDDITEFYLKFSLDNELNNVYLYELRLDRQRVHTEKLYLVNDKRQKLFTRRMNKITCNEIFGNTDNIVLRSNASFFSTIFQYGINNSKMFYDFFSSFQSNVKDYGNREVEINDDLAKFYYKNPAFLNLVSEELKRFDTGINSVKVSKLKTENNLEVYISLFSHIVDGEYKDLPWFSESLGTIRLYNIFADIILAIVEGGIIVIDEIDTHLHSSIVPELIGYFSNPNMNKKNAQLIFTSHSNLLLDQAKKYRSYLFMKEDNESFCYRIDELKGNVLIRNDKPISPLYKSGALGGLPNVTKKQ